MKSALELVYLYETALNSAIRSEYENGQNSETTKSAWSYARSIREQLVKELQDE